MEVVRPAAGTHIFFVDDDCLLLSEPRQEIYGLNTTAALIWCCLQDGKSCATIVDELVSLYGLCSQDATCFVQSALAEWRALGLLAAAPVEGQPALPPCEPAVDVPPHTTVPFIAERFYRLLGSRLCLRYMTSEHVALVHPVLGHLQCPSGATADHVFEIIQTNAGIAVYRDGEGCLACRSLDELAPLVKGLVWSTAVNDHDFFIAFHAGVVCGPAGALLLPGASGSGKSTLTAMLVHSGYEYYSDEFALLRPGDLQVLPLPLSLCVKDTGVAVLATCFPALRDLPVHKRVDGKRVVYMPPPADRLPRLGEVQRVHAIVFPHYHSGAEMVCRRISSADALRRLAQECLVVQERLDADRVGTMLDWLKGLACLELTFGSADHCIPVLQRILSVSDRDPDSAP